MSGPREDAAREWLDAGHREQWYEDDKCDLYGCGRPWWEHPAMLLAAIDAADPNRDLDAVYRIREKFRGAGWDKSARACNVIINVLTADDSNVPDDARPT